MTGDSICIEIPGPPRGQGRPKATIRGSHAGVYTDAKTAAYQNLIALESKRVMGKRPPMAGPITLTLFARFPLPASISKKERQRRMDEGPTKKPDLSNILKAAEDGMNGIVFRDDAQITKTIAVKMYSDTPGLEIWVSDIL